MKCISLIQPWASLVITGAKQYETRSRPTNYRGVLGIHASVAKHYGPPRDKISCRELCYRQPFNQFITGGLAFDALPFGMIIGTVELVDCEPTIDVIERITDQEFAFGDYRLGRFAMRLINPVKFKQPIPARGNITFPWEYVMPVIMPEPTIDPETREQIDNIYKTIKQHR